MGVSSSGGAPGVCAGTPGVESKWILTAQRARQAKALEAYKKKLLEHREWEAKVRNLRMGLRDLNKDYDKTEDDLKALQ